MGPSADDWFVGLSSVFRWKGRFYCVKSSVIYEPESTLIRHQVCFAPRSWTSQTFRAVRNSIHLQVTQGCAAAFRWDSGRFGVLGPLFPNASSSPYLFKQLQNLDPCSDLDLPLSFAAYNFSINVISFMAILFIDPHPGYFMSAG